LHLDIPDIHDILYVTSRFGQGSVKGRPGASQGKLGAGQGQASSLTYGKNWKIIMGRSFTLKQVSRSNTITSENLRDQRRQRREPRSTTPRVSIVIPAKNEARNLKFVLPELPQAYEVILVDGHSVDDTVATARLVMPSIQVVAQSRLGKGNAMVCGFTAATGDIIVMFDADGSADPQEIPRFVDALVAGADYAKGSRRMESGGSEDITRLRNAGNRALNRLNNLLFRTKSSDLCYGYNAFWRDILEDLDLPSPYTQDLTKDGMVWGDGFEIETLLSCRVASSNLSVTEVPSVERLRVHGVSNLNALSDGLRVLRTIFVEHRRKIRVDRRVNVSLMLEPSPSEVAGVSVSEGVVVVQEGFTPVELTEVEITGTLPALDPSLSGQSRTARVLVRLATEPFGLPGAQRR
jgi:hypothetical protein